MLPAGSVEFAHPHVLPGLRVPFLLVLSRAHPEDAWAKVGVTSAFSKPSSPVLRVSTGRLPRKLRGVD